MKIESKLFAAATLATAIVLSACSGGSPLTTSSLFGSGKKPEAPAPETSQDRLVQVATTSARAQRCGYVFDPTTVRTQYLASEASRGGTPDQLAKIEKGYDYTFASIAKGIAGEKEYCSDEQTATIKRDLTKVLAGDFSAPSKGPDVGIFSNGASAPMDREKIFNPMRK